MTKNRLLSHVHFVWLEMSLVCVWLVWLLLQGNLSIIETNDSFDVIFSTRGGWDTVQCTLSALTFVYFIIEVFVDWRKNMRKYPADKKRVFRSDILDDEVE